MPLSDIFRRLLRSQRSNRRLNKPRRRAAFRALACGLEALEDRNLLTANVSAAFTVTQDWGSGFQGQFAISNQQAVSVPAWQLEFDFSKNITSVWDATIVSHTGNHYVVKGASYDSTLAAQSQLTFGFLAAGSSSGVTPSNYELNGVPLGSQGAALPSLSIGNVSMSEGNSGQSNMTFNVALSAASTSQVTVNYATSNGTAQAGSDYLSTSGTLTFAPGQTIKQIQVPILGDTTVESDETFTVTLSGAAGAIISQPTGTGTIVNDDVAPSNGNYKFQVTSDWGSGFTGQVTMTNSASQPITNWQLQFNFSGQITSIWDASIVSHVGNQYVVQNAGWNSTIAAGGQASFGFNGSPGNVTTSPTNYLLTSGSGGNSGGGSGGGTGGGSTNVDHAPTPANDVVLVNPGQATVINVLANDSDPDGDALSVASFTQPKQGAVVQNKDGTLTYTPAAGFTGSDSFSYTVSDGRGMTARAVVSLTVGTPAATGAWPAQFFAPYVDVTLYPTYNLTTAVQSAGTKYFTLAFITSDSNNQPAWGGYNEYEVNGGTFDMALRQQVAQVRAAGGDVMASFGGEAGQELAQTITNVSQLTAAYQTVITDYNLSHIDFDIEGAAVADHASIDRRSQALAALQQAATAAGHPLSIWFTLPALPTGLTADGLYVLQSALHYGVQIGGVNVMAMDYGDSAAPQPAGQMGTYAIDAANSLFSQLQTLYGSAKTSAQLWSMVGVTPMIGVNDASDEIFDEAAATQLTAFAEQHGMGRISMWSLNRDVAGTAKNYADSTSSSINQKAYDFSRIFGAI
jgi:hypothetical protein